MTHEHNIQQAIEQGNIAHARELLREALKTPTAETYFLASQVAVTEQQKRQMLEQAIALDAFHEQAQFAIAQLDQEKHTTPRALLTTDAPPSFAHSTVKSVSPSETASTPPKRPTRRIVLGLLGALIVGAAGLLGVTAFSNQSRGSAPTLARVGNSNVSNLQPVELTSTAIRRSGTITRAAVLQQTQNVITQRTVAAQYAQQITLAKAFLEDLFEKRYQAAGSKACRALQNVVYNGRYSPGDKLTDALFGSQTTVSSVSCEYAGGKLLCAVQGSSGIMRDKFRYNLDVVMGNENGKACVASMRQP